MGFEPTVGMDTFSIIFLIDGRKLLEYFQTPTTKKQSKPLKDFEVVMEKIQQNKIPTEFYSMVEFMKNAMNHKK